LEKVSIVIPAHNAAETIAETIESLLAQTYQGWEAIVVDDGSTDGTAQIAASFAERDARIRVISQPQQGGVSTARNTGIASSHYYWLLFLDSDDWISPQHLERMMDTLAFDPTLDAVHCGSARVAPDGTLIPEEFWPPSGDLFSTLARQSAFPIHACIVRRSLVEVVGGFDTSLRTCEDWDLWQRIARTGARFGAVREVLSFYRMRANSVSLDGFQMFVDALRVLKQGHKPDTRVKNPHPDHANGLPIELLPSQVFYCLGWCAGLALGCGKDARPLLDVLKDYRYPQIDPNGVAQNIFKAVPISQCQSPNVWIKLWPSLERCISEFLITLEEHTQALGLARRALIALEGLILEYSKTNWPLTIGSTHGVRIETTEPIPDILLPSQVERLRCTVEIEGDHIGTIELPVCDGIVPRYVLADAISADFAWPILGRFFERTVYRELRVLWESRDISVWRGQLHLGNLLPDSNHPFWSQVHNSIGWTVFLQEVWGHPDWPLDRFYDPGFAEEKTPLHLAENGWLTIEVSGNIPDIEFQGQELNIVLTVGGVAIGVIAIPVRQNILRAHELLVALTIGSGYELCRVAVREGLLGRPMADQPVSLRARLSEAAALAQHSGDSISLEMPANTILTPGSAHALYNALQPSKSGVILGQRSYGAIGTSTSRRATLPVGALHELIESASVAGDPVIRILDESEQPEWVIYAPDLFHLRPLQHKYVSVTKPKKPQVANSIKASVYDRHHFEKTFAIQPDPWKYTSPYEQVKYEQTLSLLPPKRITRALELACGEGHFTVQLAPRVGSLIAADISQTALSRASQRCTGLENIRFVHLDLTRDPLPGRFELIVCSEVLYFVGGRAELKAVARKLADALDPGGYLLMAHANLIVDEPDRTGFDWDLPFGAKVIGETFASTYPLRLLKEIRTPLYRIQLFQHSSGLRHLLRWRNPEVINYTEQPVEPIPEVAAHILWQGGSPRHTKVTGSVVTCKLPILMYHRIASTGSSTTVRYRVTPESFEEQLSYLRDAGFYSIGLEDWRIAMEARKPLPGRAVLITFDDGYLDFFTHAWPLLKHYGFSATVFLVADEIGRTNTWDHSYGEEIPLLGWKEIRRLRDEGVEFGSHSVSHRPLTGLSVKEIVREGARSRAILERGLEQSVTAFAYPYGAEDRVIEHLIGACGYIYGLSCRPNLSGFHDSLLALPRIEITGSDTLQDFIAKLCVD
jgi:peptidoglycan/xylan/chitin deacetylase (PgdA/CDA1 family)/SAM-dependent methyltransferase